MLESPVPKSCSPAAVPADAELLQRMKGSWLARTKCIGSSISRFSLCLFFISSPLGMAEDLGKEPQSQGQAESQTTFIPISAGKALQLELGR